jgi:hypothetical protein
MHMKFLAEQFGNAPTGSDEERRWASLLIRYILGPTRLRGMSGADYEALVKDLMTTGNEMAESGCDRCTCGCKYWENDRCVDCRSKFEEASGC